MILNEIKPYSETSGTLEEKFFGVADLGMVFSILRSKLYSNPILAVAREISCNARDSMREAGRPDEPITIQLPTGLEPNYKVKDTGVGISPDRMYNVFINYTASTKREDNIQGGGYGLGSKTCWAVAESFSVTTVHDNIKYSYVCFIDETKVGKIALLSKENTEEINSTEISIPVKPIDFNFFRQYTEQACRHWTVKPIITGGQLKWETFSKIIEGKDWVICKQENYYDNERTVKLVIDGIEYPLEITALRKYADSKLIDACRGNLIMYFGIGELSLSANREQIYLDKPTQEKIKTRLADISLEMKKLVDNKISSFPNLWDANVYYRKELADAFSSLSFLGKLTWRNYPLHDKYVKLDCRIYSYMYHSRWSRKDNAEIKKLRCVVNGSIEFSENSALYVNDLSIQNLTPRHIKKAFENNPTLERIQVICPNDKQSEEDLNLKINLDQMAPKKLSTITKVSSRVYTSPAQKLLIFKFDAGACAFRQVSYALMEEDNSSKVLCLLSRTASSDVRVPITANGNCFAISALQSLLRLDANTSFYGIDKDTDKARVVEEFSDFKTLDILIDEKVLNNKTINYTEIKFAKLCHCGVNETVLNKKKEFQSLIKDKKSLFIIRLELHERLKKIRQYDKSLLDIYESVKGIITELDINKFIKNNPDLDFEKINKLFYDKYPLLDLIEEYNYSNYMTHIAQYVNMIDKI